MDATANHEIHQELHALHAEHESWNSDLVRWTDQHHRLSVLLRQAAELMRVRARSLELHGIAIETMEQRMKILDNALTLSPEISAELHQSRHATHQEHVRQQAIHHRLQVTQESIAADIERLLQDLEPLCVLEGTARVG